MLDITLLAFPVVIGATNAQSLVSGRICYRDIVLESSADLAILNADRCNNLRSLEIRSGITAFNITSVKTIRYGLNVTGTNIRNFAAPNLDTVGSPGVYFASNRDLVNIDMASLRYINGHLYISNNPSVKRITFPKLSTVYGDIRFSGGFDTAELPSLAWVSGTLITRTTKKFDCTDFEQLKLGRNGTVGDSVICRGSDETALTLSPAKTGPTKTILAIAISISIGVTAILGIVAYWLIRRRRKRRNELPEPDATSDAAELSDHKGPARQTQNVYPIELDVTDPLPETQKGSEFELEAKEPVVINYPPGVKLPSTVDSRKLPITGSEHSVPEGNRRGGSELSGTIADSSPLEHQVSPRSQGMGETVSPSSATQAHSWEMSAVPTPSDELSVSYRSENTQSANLNTSPTGYQEHSEPRAPNLTVDTSLVSQPIPPAPIVSQPDQQTLPISSDINPVRNTSSVEDDELQWLEEQEAMIRARKARLLQSQARSRNDARNS